MFLSPWMSSRRVGWNRGKLSQKQAMLQTANKLSENVKQFIGIDNWNCFTGSQLRTESNTHRPEMVEKAINSPSFEKQILKNKNKKHIKKINLP